MHPQRSHHHNRATKINRRTATSRGQYLPTFPTALAHLKTSVVDTWSVITQLQKTTKNTPFLAWSHSFWWSPAQQVKINPSRYSHVSWEIWHWQCDYRFILGAEPVSCNIVSPVGIVSPFRNGISEGSFCCFRNKIAPTCKMSPSSMK